jgi:DNA-binding transcriptional ArsR family regulator
MKKATKFFKALANDRRLEILKLLKDKKGEMIVGEISNRIHLSYKSTSKHLLVLENVGLIKRRQRRLEVFYSLNQETAEKPVVPVDF